MNRKGDIKIMGQSFVAIVISLAGLAILLWAAFNFFDAIFGGEGECAVVENKFNLLHQYVENYESGALISERVVNGVNLGKNCMIFGFDKGEDKLSLSVEGNSVSITRPRQCGSSDSCLCLCEAKNRINEKTCSVNNVCHRYKNIKGFVGEHEDLAISSDLRIDRSDPLSPKPAYDPLDLYVNIKNGNICISKNSGVCV